MIFDLTGKVVIVTGASGHLGAHIVRALAGAHANVVLVGRDQTRLNHVTKSLPQDYSTRTTTFVCDILKTDARRQLVDKMRDQFGQVHGIVNNAYSGKTGGIEHIDAADFSAACEYNLSAPFDLVKRLIPLLEESIRQTESSASVVNIGSMYGSVSPDPRMYYVTTDQNPVHYGATKAAMLQMTRYLACFLGSRQIRVNCVSPGPFPTAPQDLQSQEFQARLCERVPLGRIGMAEEIGGPVVFLLSDEASYVTGANLAVDGGWTAW